MSAPEISQEFYDKFKSVFRLAFNGRNVMDATEFNRAFERAAEEVQEDFPKSVFFANAESESLMIFADQSPFINLGDAHKIVFNVVQSGVTGFRYVFNMSQAGIA